MRSWPTEFSRKTRDRVLTLVLDVVGCAAEGRRLATHPGLAEHAAGVDGDARIWFHDRSTERAHAALVNGTVAHHAELDDGDPRAGLHGGVTVIPAAIAVAETEGSTGRELVDAIAFGYAAAVAYGRPLLERIERHRLHPPAMVGCFGAAAASARLLGLDDDAIDGAIALAGTLMPLAPFESFTKGATVKDVYGGYPAHVGVRSAELARDGVSGPRGFFRGDELDPDEVSHVYIKPWAFCRATHAALTALEKLLPLEKPMQSVDVETYRFAVELSEDANPATAIGAKASIPKAVESLLGEPVSDRVSVRLTERVGRYAKVTVRFVDGSERWAEATGPRNETRPREKFRALVDERAEAIENAVDRLLDSPDISELTGALR